MQRLYEQENMMDLLSILMQPAETWNYFLLGYGICFGVMGLYLVSYFVRFRNLKQEYELLQELDTE
jgi:hypothetical protein